MLDRNGEPLRVVLLYNIEPAWTPQEIVECITEVDLMIEALQAGCGPIERAEVCADVAEPLHGIDPSRAVIFNWCEGISGKPNAYDLVAQALDDMGFAYTGSDAWTLRNTQNKASFKTILNERGIPTPRWRVFTDAHAAHEWEVFPAIVKPVAEHASSGITLDSVVEDMAGLERQVQYVMNTFGVGALVEEFIAGREIYASIWGNGTPEVLPLHEVEFLDIDDPRQQIIDYEAKWLADSFRYQHSPERFPSRLQGPAADRVRAAALGAYQALRCRDYGRIDLRLREDMPYVVDVNANCDITIDGGFAKTAQAAGYNYGQMVSRIIGWADRRRPG